LSSTKAVEDAIIAERDRQIDLIESGGAVEGETRGWTLGSKTTKRLRGKEGEIDYRYMPDPDIAPVFIGQVSLACNNDANFLLIVSGPCRTPPKYPTKAPRCDC
jgi:Asp-tRNA(Asn)/Glu-tRNA(Gln) amidotransferase B subunit